MGTDRFYSKELNENQKARIDLVRRSFTDIYNYVDVYIPSGREKSLYTTKLEEACMWAVKAIAEEKETEA